MRLIFHIPQDEKLECFTSRRWYVTRSVTCACTWVCAVTHGWSFSAVLCWRWKMTENRGIRWWDLSPDRVFILPDGLYPQWCNRDAYFSLLPYSRIFRLTCIAGTTAAPEAFNGGAILARVRHRASRCQGVGYNHPPTLFYHDIGLSFPFLFFYFGHVIRARSYRCQLLRATDTILRRGYGDREPVRTNPPYRHTWTWYSPPLPIFGTQMFQNCVTNPSIFFFLTPEG